MTKPIVIDVREADEYAEGHVEGALNITATDLMSGASQLAQTPKDSEIIVYCRSGSRSNVAMHLLRQQGFTNLTNGINKDQVMARYGDRL
ncbi:MAG TPA: rhodanese-like domain-containing protein [Candidatus Saccharimonadales bacterium]